MAVGGLTDKQTMQAIMRETRDRRRPSTRVRELAAKGLRPPHALTPDETRELCGFVMGHGEHSGPR